MIRVIFIIAGTISLVLGIAGIFLPLLPTTPFLLLSAYLYLKSSPRLYNWLINQPYLGTYIRNYNEKKIIPVPAKIMSLTLMWGSILYCVCILIQSNWIRVILILISIGVTFHILSFKSK